MIVNLLSLNLNLLLKKSCFHFTSKLLFNQLFFSLIFLLDGHFITFCPPPVILLLKKTHLIQNLSLNDLSLVHVYFRELAMIKYDTDLLFTWQVLRMHRQLIHIYGQSAVVAIVFAWKITSSMHCQPCTVMCSWSANTKRPLYSIFSLIKLI